MKPCGAGMLGAITAWVALLACTPAMAALGAAPDTGAQPGANAPAAGTRQLQNAPPAAGYTVWTSVLPTGTVVQEYANASGQVFALRWQGPVLPDLQQFLGSHVAEYQQSAQQQRASGRRSAFVGTHTANIVISSHGRMGDFKGHAYLPALVPAGLNIQTLLP